MKTFTEYASQRSISNLAATIVEGGYDIEEVTGFLNSIIEENEHQDGEVILNELLSGLMNVGKGLVGGAMSGLKQGAQYLGNKAVQGVQGAASGIAQGAKAAGQYMGDKYQQGQQGAQLQGAMKQLQGVAATLQKLGVTNPQVQQLFSQLNNHLTQLSQRVAGDRTARVGPQGNVATQMPPSLPTARRASMPNPALFGAPTTA